MRKTQGRRPLVGAAPDSDVTISNSNLGKVADPGTEPQPSAMQSFWTAAGGFVTCTIIRRFDRPRWLAALAARDETAIAFERALFDWITHALEHSPICLSCEVTFSRRSLPADWAMLNPLWGRPGTVMLSGICGRCSAKSDAELLNAALRDLQAQNSPSGGSRSPAGQAAHDLGHDRPGAPTAT
jgi:hypothetical protein